MSNETPLRERNRRRTRRRIEDAATSLVVAHGFANVTVDDICRDAEISRRTFFNYMDSKDEAILGPSPWHSATTAASSSSPNPPTTSSAPPWRTSSPPPPRRRTSPSNRAPTRSSWPPYAPDVTRSWPTNQRWR
ncbi:TetR/AcrR family transcriptional regulator [Corynebacterium suedekumii]|nr:TetR/AcrR family transcriptional regulator [Corynebacterium suedekumii]